MTKKFLSFLFIALTIAYGCNQAPKENAEEASADTVLLTVATFDTSASYYVDQPVWIEGTVLHTCKHGGKRMFLVDGNDSIMVEVTTGPDIVMFDESLVGSRVNVLGILKEERIDEKYLNEWEAELMKPAEENHEAGVHEGTKGHEEQPKEAKLEQINALRNQIASSGSDHISRYSIEAISFQEIPTVEEEIVVEEE
ncbi:MAG: OB-fold nucleic acid binding domain-containing protein [Bacteroidales bacterium]|nr:OB-fold nucleic acid binding domain-containing protein [Bacteroidales bacterium]